MANPARFNFGEAMVGNWQGAGLIKESVLKPVLTTIEQGLVLGLMGKARGICTFRPAGAVGSLGLERVQQRHAEGLEVGHVAGHHRQAVDLGGGRNHGVLKQGV